MSKDKGDLTTYAGEEDKIFEGDVRPRRLRDYIGQKSMHDQLSVFLKATLKRKEPSTMCLSTAHLAWERLP